MKIIILTPVYNDWKSFACLVKEINKKSAVPSHDYEIIVINDGSTSSFFPVITDIPITQLNLIINVGHQRAISIGLSYIHENCRNYDYVIVMDSDGEDKPEDISELLRTSASCNHQKIIFAARKKRYETGLFKGLYFLYKMLFRIFTGKSILFGNFSCIPVNLLPKIISNPDLWNHYSGSILMQGTPYISLPFDKGKRYFDKSKMSFVKLILHGLSSISVYLDLVSIRLLLFSLIAILIGLISVIFIIYLKIFTDLSIPGWASNISLLIFNIIIQFSLITFLILLQVLHNRNSVQIPPKKFYKDYIDSIIILKEDEKI